MLLHLLHFHRPWWSYAVCAEKHRSGKIDGNIIFNSNLAVRKMTDSVLEQITEQIVNDPRSGQSLLLFALTATLNVEKTGHLYMLAKLKEFTPENRQLAYGVIELMANNGVGNDTWNEAYSKMEAAIRG